PILPLLLEPMVFPDDVAYWLEGAQWIEVLDEPAEHWLDPVRRALALMGYSGLTAVTEDVGSGHPFIELPPNNLPEFSSPLIGRDRELRQIDTLLEPGRVVTLTGAGGSGKTRLAAHAARKKAHAFSDGIWFADASSAITPVELAELIARIIDVMETQSASLSQTIALALRESNTLLVVDNLEQIPDAAAVIDEIVDGSGISVLATSRAPLRSRNEMVIPVSPLQAPEIQADTPASVIGKNPAVQLFVERARLVKPDFQLSDGNAYEVAMICTRLDGLPLAIELAAARSRLLHPAALLQRLENRLGLLTRGSGKSARQQTLHDSIAWSYDLLDPVEQKVFRQLAVFAGGASVNMVEQVATSVDDGISPDDVLNAIEELIDHSLLTIDVTHNVDDGTRVRMLETIREFASEALARDGELESTARSHAHWSMTLARQVAPELESGQQSVAMSKLIADQQNLASALRYLSSSERADDQELALEMAGTLWRFWWMRGAFSEGLRQTDHCLESSVGLHSVERARALNGAGVLAFSLGDLSRSGAYHRAALDLCEEIGATDELARSLDNLGIVHVVSGNVSEGIEAFESALEMYQRASDRRGEAVAFDHLAGAWHAADNLELSRDYAERSLAAWRALHDQRGIGLALEQLGMTAMYQGAYDESAKFLEEALSLAEMQDEPVSIGNALLNLSSTLELSGDPDAAATLLERARALFELAGDTRSTAYATYQQGHVARSRGRTDEAGTLLTSALESLTRLGQQDAVALCLESLAGVAVDSGDFSQGARLFGQARRVREASGLQIPQTRIAEIARDMSEARRQMGDGLFEQTYLNPE
ncbi:MAG: tetratricopeptide repeat protein, partial [Thermomicrobiales bacterium]